MTLDSDIQNAYSATQILLVFLSVLFGIRYQEFKKLISEKIPGEKYSLDELDKEIDVIYRDKCLVLLGVNILVLILFLPIFCFIIYGAMVYITTPPVHFVYNFTQISFIVITLMISGLVKWSYNLKEEILEHQNKVKEELIKHQ